MYEKGHVQKIVAVAIVMANAPQYPDMKHWCLQSHGPFRLNSYPVISGRQTGV